LSLLTAYTSSCFAFVARPLPRFAVKAKKHREGEETPQRSPSQTQRFAKTRDRVFKLHPRRKLRRSSSTVWLSCIMPTMFSRRSSFARIGASILPLILLWSFVACLALCAEHLGEGHDDSAQATLQSMGDSHEDESCPVPTSSLLLPSRQSDGSAPQVVGAIHPPCHMARAAAHTATKQLRSSVSRSSLASTSDPPLKRLGSLRI